MENRTIKFRGKDSVTGEWFYGNLFTKDNKGRTHISTPERGCLRIDPDTVGQFTELLDKNGTEIYEGDILGCPEDDWFLNETVFFAEGCFMVKDGYTTTPMCAIDAQYRTVIGNIHNHPSLISDKQ